MKRENEQPAGATESAAAGRGDLPVAAPENVGEVTPMMEQYLAIKAAHPDYLLFYRMGDFYELFFDDAVHAAKALDITLTKRGRHLGDDIAMCGVPVHAADGYLARLIRKGYKVAVGEQVEDPAEARKRGAKSVVRREVVRLVTPGTLTEDALLDARAHNFLSAVARVDGALALASVDISTGDFTTSAVDLKSLDTALARLNPGELLISTRLADDAEIAAQLAGWAAIVSALPPPYFDSLEGEKRLKQIFQVSELDGFGSFGRAELAACGALIGYLEETQKGRLPALRPPAIETQGQAMMIDAATRRNLELCQTLDGKREGSLISVIDRTVTGAGARLLFSRLSAPLAAAADINRRLDGLGYFIEEQSLAADIRQKLRRCPDGERALSRLSLGRGGPRDLAALRDCLGQAAAIRQALEIRTEKGAVLDGPPAEVARATQALGRHEPLVDLISRALKPELPMLARDGGFVAQGFDAALDEFRMLRDESRRLIAALEAKYIAATGISSLKIKHNNVLGYHIDLKPAAAARMFEPDLAQQFTHRQTLANAVRFNTPELAELAAKIAEADVRGLAREFEIFDRLAAETLARSEAIMTAAEALAGLDVATALADLALEYHYTRPVVDDGTAFEITGGRHPVVEAALKSRVETPFVANDCNLGPESRLWLITGPNMAGKSTFLRQNALIAVLAQMGSYVPAASARIGVVDRLFSRVGASDDLARGRSTFMVEMVETAVILNQAGPRALVILDEIGRGTSTYDGLSIAWAAVEHLHEVNRSRALFATHYHELKLLSERLPRLALHAMKVREWKGDVIFLHEVGPGSADRSYGIQVARLAGLPPAVVMRAEQVLASLEKGERSGANLKLANDLPLFAAVREQAEWQRGPRLSAIEQAIDALAPDDLTPRSALEFIYKLKTLRNEAG